MTAVITTHRGDKAVSTLAIVSALLVTFATAGCGEECKSEADCGDMQRCVSGKCAAIALTDDTDEPPVLFSEVPKDTESERIEKTDGTDSSGAGDGGMDSDTTGEVGSDDLFGNGRDGAPCGVGPDCASGYCQGNICCPSGKCCEQPGNAEGCPIEVCKTGYCDGNYQCRYFNLPVGRADQAGTTTCDGNHRCDGGGNCIDVAYCASAAYKGTGLFSVEGAAVAEGCRSSCLGDSHCNSGYACVGGVCAQQSAGSDTNCLKDSDCATGRCDLALHICCPSGQCCVSDETCGRYSCNGETRQCNTRCGSAEEDDETGCSSLGNYHCDNGWCYDDLVNGAKWCDEDADCLSGHCDKGSAMCCAQGECCNDDDDCDGTRCQVNVGNNCPDTCALEGVDDDTLCRENYLCRDGVCLSGALEDGEACAENDACASGRCENGYCCDEGECCASAEDCSGDSLCNVASCQANAQCIYYSLSCGAHDIDGAEICVGDNRCDGYGNCVAVAECEGGFVGDDFVCDAGTVAVDCNQACAGDNNCLDTYHCEDEACVEDLLQGESGCDNNRDCLEGHCNVETAVCCVSGYCCANDDECGDFLTDCDEETHSCRVSCGENADCEELGNYYCVSGVCEPVLLNGDRFCFANEECASGYCDASNGVCCTAGKCCLSDAGCGGFACDEAYSCVEDCTGDDNLCMDGWFCNLDVCEPQKPNGALCASDLDCASDHCDDASDVCCEGEGACCLNTSDCESDNRCLKGYCSAAFACVYDAKANGESCEDGLFCNGQERCSDGVCSTSAVPCGGGGFCLESVCDENLDECLDVPVNEGENCSEALFCIGNISMKCTEMGICADPGTGTPPCGGETANACTSLTCDENANTCRETAKVDGIPCSDDPCEGETACEGGECLLMGNPPCDDGNPCTTDECSVSEGSAVCGGHFEKDDGETCEYLPCMGENATCQAGYCIPAPERPCTDRNICTEDLCDAYGDEYECGLAARSVLQMACGEQLTIHSYEFSRELYAYNENCLGDFTGMEVAVAVNSAAGNLTFVVAETAPPTQIEILHLSNLCDTATCAAKGTGSLAVMATGAQQAFVLEAPGVAPPTTMEVSVTCE